VIMNTEGHYKGECYLLLVTLLVFVGIFIHIMLSYHVS
jgi:hypothetical protein